MSQNNMLRSFLLLLGLIAPISVNALWTGIVFTMGDDTIPVNSGTNALSLTPSSISFQVEDTTNSGLRVGVLYSQTSIDLKSDTLFVSEDANALGIYLRYRQLLNDYISFPLALSITKYLAAVENDEESNIEYLEKKVSAGIAFQFKQIRLASSLVLRQISGEYNHLDNGFSFEQSDKSVRIYEIDFFLEKTAFIRFRVSDDSDGTFQLSFARIF